MVEVQGVSKRYGGVEALNGVTLTAEQGRVLGLLGQNGAGKTTLLNIITGCLAPIVRPRADQRAGPAAKPRAAPSVPWATCRSIPRCTTR